MPGRRSHIRPPRRRSLRWPATVALVAMVLGVAGPVVLARAAMATVPENGLFPPVCVAFPTSASAKPGTADARHCPLCFFHTCAADMGAPTVSVLDHPPLPVGTNDPEPSQVPGPVRVVLAASPRGPPAGPVAIPLLPGRWALDRPGPPPL